MNTAVVYIHGMGGSAAEADHYAALFPHSCLIGFDYLSRTPWEAQSEFRKYFHCVTSAYERVIIIANSIGAFFSLCSLGEQRIDRAFFISPILDMEAVIAAMMCNAGVTETVLREKGEIPTAFGEALSWEYLQWVRTHPIRWSVPTEILYGKNDSMQSFGVIRSFADRTGAGVTVMENGEHWFHTEEQMDFLDQWIRQLQP